MPGTGTTTIKFQSSRNVAIRDVYDGGNSEYNYTYTTSGSTVTIELDSGTTMRLAYSSGQLFRIIFTKVS